MFFFLQQLCCLNVKPAAAICDDAYVDRKVMPSVSYYHLFLFLAQVKISFYLLFTLIVMCLCIRYYVKKKRVMHKCDMPMQLA
jgi:hypothetical protein